MAERFEIRLAGSGGQGLVLGGLIMSEAAAIFDGIYATQTQSYGPESRGGASKSEVVLSKEEVDYPKATNPDVVLLFTEAAAEKYLPMCKEDAIVIADADLVKTEIPDKYKKKVIVPLTKIAKEGVGREFVANIIAIGLIRELTGIVTEASLEKALMERVPKGTEEMNRKALALGKEAAHTYGKHVLDMKGK
ncbi:MAG TPA: 2-oxoacid:acceptor oxidoreductase family protein [Acidobacteriota bacterium]|jgi:2-oxoglutarate ferredoxin oxidoreductase subunit gamma|nr:2-oxoacid:acceptor oxidoreductase family protein [Acidobacteriota bacterium]HNT17298.1 2-oxoacid:acceptor oxidoreductase family protein [Acidobacteriota bacterium]HPA26361.1 2-oxoacid:acceptor oxidoreductase family protein [Acidobacteriota bacterium]HQO19743.1 2-oxoacid:acceptor oxidoreductase family protein [Acidobacteriota bacterium]HQQ46343.1 2-oxoacid:acceptor oxidoreductase family protein [Acidobacteriota bacterium]